MLMSPMLMLRGISGRFMFFTAETARAGAADSPPCQNKSMEKDLQSGSAGWALARRGRAAAASSSESWSEKVGVAGRL